MIEAPAPENEEERLKNLYSYGLLEEALGSVLERIVAIAADTCGTEVSFISLMDRDEQHFLVCRGMDPVRLPRAVSFCAHALLTPDTIFEVPDATQDERFFDNPAVTGGFGVRFYASQPLVTRAGFALGGLCLLDKQPRSLTDAQRMALRKLGEIVMTLFESHKAARDTSVALEAHIGRRTRELESRETRLHEGEERFRDFAEAASDWFWEMDEDLRFTYLSPNVERVIGVPATELLGKTREDGLGEDYDRDVWDAHLRTLRAHLPFRDFTYAWKGERWIRVSGKPIFDEDGAFRGYRGIGTDISEIMQSELAMRRSEARFRDFAESSADWFWEMDEDLRFTWMTPNVEQIVGVPPEWHYGKTREDLLGDNYDKEYWDAHLRVLQAHEPFRDFVFLRQGDGLEPRWIRTSGKPIFGGAGRFLGYRGIASDVTATRVMEEQLHQAQKMETIGQLTGGVAHDFNNLLGVVIGNLDFLAESEGINADQRKLIATALQSALRGAELTNRLLAFSRNQLLKPEATDLNVLIDGMMGLLERTLGEAIDIAVVPTPSLWKTQLDPAQLESALLNLAVNALHAMPNGGRLTIETGNVMLDASDTARWQGVAPGRYAMLTVSDTGCGIPAHILDQVFEPFFTTKAVGKGSGLGLSMVHGFVKQSEGHVTVDSTVGDGTAICLYFPALPEDIAPAGRDPEPENSAAGTGETVLVVEDDAELRHLAATVIGTLGYRVVEAPDGPEALELLASGVAVDLLFTDVVLPHGMDGQQLAQEALRQHPELKVLFTSGYTDGGSDLISKPYLRRELARRLQQALHRSDMSPDAGHHTFV